MIVSPYGNSLASPPRERAASGGGVRRWGVLARGRCVFAGQLRRDVRIGASRLLRRLLVHLQTGLASPGTLQLVLDVESKPAETVDLELDLVAVLEGVEAAVVGAGGDDVARLQGVDRGQPLDAARDLVCHIAGVEVLHQGAVVPQPDLQFVRVRDLALGHQARADRREGVARLHLEEDVARRWQTARRAIYEVRITKD